MARSRLDEISLFVQTTRRDSSLGRLTPLVLFLAVLGSALARPRGRGGAGLRSLLHLCKDAPDTQRRPHLVRDGGRLEPRHWRVELLASVAKMLPQSSSSKCCSFSAALVEVGYRAGCTSGRTPRRVIPRTTRKK